jgi:hypothetical protein
MIMGAASPLRVLVPSARAITQKIYHTALYRYDAVVPWCYRVRFPSPCGLGLVEHRGN